MKTIAIIDKVSKEIFCLYEVDESVSLMEVDDAISEELNYLCCMSCVVMEHLQQRFGGRWYVPQWEEIHV